MKSAGFSWIRVPSLEKSPLRDHTYDEEGEGHILYLDSTAPPSIKRLRDILRYGDEAKLYSPMFPATSPEENYCLIFYHYSFGFTPGMVFIRGPSEWKMQFFCFLFFFLNIFAHRYRPSENKQRHNVASNW